MTQDLPLGLDGQDRAILRILQGDARRSVDSIGAEVGLSPSAVSRRIQRLRAAGVILRETAVVDPKALGYDLTVFAEVMFETERPELVDAFQRWVAGEAAVQGCWYVSGEADCILLLLVRNVEAYEGFMTRLLAENRNVRRYKTSFALSKLKAEFAVPTE